MATQLDYRTIREYYRLTQGNWGAALGVTAAAVSQWETGRRSVPGWADAIYDRLQRPIGDGDLKEIDRLRSRIEWGACAIVASRDVLFGMARMLQVFAESHFRTSSVFRDVAEAGRWLDSMKRLSD